MEGIIITINKETLSDLIQSAVKSALTEFRKTASLHQEFHDDLLPAEEAAAFMDIKLSTLYYKTHNREIPFMKRGKKIYCSRNDCCNGWDREDNIQGQNRIIWLMKD